jgi:hypothetical protein
VLDGSRLPMPRWPSWNTHTSAPKEPAIDTRFMTIALIGRTIEPSRRKRITNVVAITKAIAIGVLSRTNSVASMSDAVWPPTFRVPSRIARERRSSRMTACEAWVSGALSRSA